MIHENTNAHIMYTSIYSVICLLLFYFDSSFLFECGLTARFHRIISLAFIKKMKNSGIPMKDETLAYSNTGNCDDDKDEFYMCLFCENDTVPS